MEGIGVLCRLALTVIAVKRKVGVRFFILTYKKTKALTKITQAQRQIQNLYLGDDVSVCSDGPLAFFNPAALIQG
jgi:hypothetical protein